MARTSVILLSSLGLLFLLITVQCKYITSGSTTCEPWKIYDKCGNPCLRNCKAIYSRCLPMCEPGCYCIEGTLENEYGKCVRVEECKYGPKKVVIKTPGAKIVTRFTSGSTTCEPWKIYDKCGNPCLRNCKAIYSRCLPMCEPGCYCIEGTLENEYGKCVRVEDCKYGPKKV
ncbi:inducible metalloproteinase inhibitor protein-like [Leptodactylus fuscus]|uniref:inducible metalloproteinase inhibitor protein-like n=1 Tax=Leptodactylus fuscus TaxID=238119 RepID=UPI003F4F10BB